MRAVYAAGLGALVAVVAVLAVPQDPALEGETTGAAQVSEQVLAPQTIPISAETRDVESWQAESQPARHRLADMPQNAHAITSSQTQITLKTWSVPILETMFAVDGDTGDIYAANGNKVQMVDVSEKMRTEWIIPGDRIVEGWYHQDRNSIVVDGKYWFVDDAYNILRLDPSTGTFTVWDVRCGSSLVADTRGHIWCDEFFGDALKLDPEQNKVTWVPLRGVVDSAHYLNISPSGSVFGLVSSSTTSRILQLSADLDSVKVWDIHKDRATASALYVAGDKAYFMSTFPYRQVLGELDTTDDTLREWSLPYQSPSSASRTSIVVNGDGVVFFEMGGGPERELHRFVPDSAEFTAFDVTARHLIIGPSDTIYMNLGRAVASAT